jgi:hypothetical protein
MRFAVEAWAPDYGAPFGAPEEAQAFGAVEERVDIAVEVPTSRWAARSPPRDVRAAESVLFIDGVRRIDARVWIEAGGRSTPGICASFAAGSVRSNDRATLEAVEVRRGLFSSAPELEAIVTRHCSYRPRAAFGQTPEQLSLALQQRMGELEVRVAQDAEEAELVVVDGPLSGRQNVPGAIGYVKTHRVAYLPPIVDDIIGALEAGQRTPLFLTTTSWSRFSWYLRLPGPRAHAWAGIVRCEAAADSEVGAAAQVADLVAATLPRFASEGHKDPRAPQNLYPVAGLERELRHRLGDPALIYRSLREVAAL